MGTVRIIFDEIYFDETYFVLEYEIPDDMLSVSSGSTYPRWDQIGSLSKLKTSSDNVGFRINRLDVLQNTDPVLTGLVNGHKASDIEERFARALDKYNIQYDFQIGYLKPHNMAGEYKLDFMVYMNGLNFPYAIDGEFAHKTASQQRKDMMKDLEFNSKKRGEFQPVSRVVYYDLDTQEHANMYVREQLLWRA